MKKFLCVVSALLLLLSLTACGGNTDSSDLPAEPLSEADLVAAAKSALGVPDVAGITHVLGDAFHYDAGECDLREIDFYEYGEFVAGAFVDVLTGEKVRNIYDYTAPEASESRTALIDVLTKKSTFTVKSVYDNKVQERSLGNFSYTNTDATANLFIPSRYTWVDMDRDGAKELIVADSKQAYFLILRYDSGKVRGYMMAYRAMYDLHTNGTFKGAESASITAINQMVFKTTEVVVFEIAYKDIEKGEYRYATYTDKETVESFFTDWEKNATHPAWVKY